MLNEWDDRRCWPQVMQAWNMAVHSTASSHHHHDGILDEAQGEYLYKVARQKHTINWSCAIPLMRLIATRCIYTAIKASNQQNRRHCASLNTVLNPEAATDDQVNLGDCLPDRHAVAAYGVVDDLIEIETAMQQRPMRYYRDLVGTMLTTGNTTPRELAEHFGGLKRADNHLHGFRAALRKSLKSLA